MKDKNYRGEHTIVSGVPRGLPKLTVPDRMELELAVQGLICWRPPPALSAPTELPTSSTGGSSSGEDSSYPKPPVLFPTAETLSALSRIREEKARAKGKGKGKTAIQNILCNVYTLLQKGA